MIGATSAPLRRIVAALPARAAEARARIAGYADAIDAAPASRRSAILAAVSLCEGIGLVPDAEAIVRRAVPDSPAPATVLARIVLGARPVDLAGGHLTRREAAAWLAAGAGPVADWILEHRSTILHDAAHLTWSPPSDAHVAAWLVERWRVPEQREALVRERAEVIAGVRVEGCFLARVDELHARDLVGGVDETFRRAAERLAKANARALASRGEPLAPEPRWWRPIRCARLLRTGPDLIAEGRALGHCVATYAHLVEARRSVIVGIHVLGHRSTVELDPATLHVRQHRGRGNSAPHPLCERALEVCLRRWREA